MRNFKMFFGVAIGIMVFLFVARIAFVALIAAAVMTIGYAIFRKAKSFMAYGQHRSGYDPHGYYDARMSGAYNRTAEPLFHDIQSRRRQPVGDVRYVETF
ncbi:MAG: hypothetical protein AB8F95_01575 [Bacteroidia bacterium]